MRKEVLINGNWNLLIEGRKEELVNLPHCYNGDDGQDGGNDYLKTVAIYKKKFRKPELNEDETLFLQFDGVNSIADVFLNGQHIAHHEGGYSRFIVEISEFLQDENELIVNCDNRDNEKVYPSKADFTFYGGIYRNVSFIYANKKHFLFHKDSSPCLKLTPTVEKTTGILKIDLEANCDEKIVIEIYDKENNLVYTQEGIQDIKIDNVHLWNGLKDPYLYKVVAKLICKDCDKVLDEVSSKIGFRTFRVDAKRGFYLNNKAYTLRGVARHQDRPHLGNAISRKDMEEDIALLKEIGANTVRLSHYQHDQYFYDLCDELGLIVWAEIPYISRYLKDGNENAKSQLSELIHQNYNHPSIVCWGISNEITMFRKEFGKACRENHKELNEFVHQEDKTRLTTIACFSVMNIFNRVAHITDLASYNLYWGWYVPFTPVTGWILDAWHLFYPKHPIGLSEYGAEGMPNLHSSKPKRFDNTEEYQAQYHEKMLKCFKKRPYIWATHVWNMFDFGSDGRNQGGEKGINHKGLVTFDRKTKKDAFFIYKAYWSDEPFVHICSKRYINRTDKYVNIKVYSNQDRVSLYHNGKLVEEKYGDKVFTFKVKLEKENDFKAVSNNLEDSSHITQVEVKDESYILKKGGNNMSWEK